MPVKSAHIDSFARDNLPPVSEWPQMRFDQIPELEYPSELNCAGELLDKMVAQGYGDKTVFVTEDEQWSYADLLERANRIAHVLVEDMQLKPGNRVLLRGPNNPMLAASWFAVLKAGGICVTTMPLLREHELTTIIEKAQISHALCDARWDQEIIAAEEKSSILKQVRYFCGEGGETLEYLSEQKHKPFENVNTFADDPALIAFTSGTTGKPKATVHFHRDVMAICDCFPRYILKPNQNDRFCGTPPFAFTFGLGALLLFPMRFGASSILIEKANPEELARIMSEQAATISFTSPTGYRAMLEHLDKFDLSGLKKCVSAGETLPKATFEAWLDKTGIKIIDGIGATEMLHIFISAADDDIRPGATGKAIPGYEAQIVDLDFNKLPAGEAGLLAVRGPTGCRYLDDSRQSDYVKNGWNLTGDTYLMDEDGYFWYQARADDMIISSGYNISGVEIEDVLLKHPDVKECGVIGVPDSQRGNVVKAFVVLRDGSTACEQKVRELQEYVKHEIAPYKYPRRLEFIEKLPRTETGKLQRFKLRDIGA